MAEQNQTEATLTSQSRMFRTRNGSRVVVTNVQDGIYSSRLYVNCSATDLGDATLIARKHKSKAGAQKWATTVLGTVAA